MSVDGEVRDLGSQKAADAFAELSQGLGRLIEQARAVNLLYQFQPGDTIDVEIYRRSTDEFATNAR